MDNNSNGISTTLYEWVGNDTEYITKSEEQLKEVFINLDKALKYIHNHGYYIVSFDPREIEILDGDVNQIKFNKIMPLPVAYNESNEMKKDDIFLSACLQIGLYTHTLNYLNIDYLKDNFDQFASNMPADDIPYYRGVIERGASVYLCEFLNEKSVRDLKKLEEELGESQTPTVINKNNFDDTNEDINNKIYKQINGLRESAFVSYFVYPVILVGIISVFFILAWLLILR